MLSYTLKSTVMGFCRNGVNDRFTITATGEQTDTIYKFITYKGIVSLELTTKDTTIRKDAIHDLDMMQLMDRTLDVTLFERETFKNDGSPYEYYKVHLDYPVRLFIELFRLLKMRAAFTIKYQDRYIDCYYISDKVRWREETDSYCNLHCADLFKLNNMFPGYEVVTVGSPLHRNNFREYITREEKIAERIGKEIKRYQGGVLQ